MIMGKPDYISHPINKFNCIAVSKTFPSSKIICKNSRQRLTFCKGHIEPDGFTGREYQALRNRNIRVGKHRKFFYLSRNIIAYYLIRISIDLDDHAIYFVYRSLTAGSKVIVLPQGKCAFTL